MNMPAFAGIVMKVDDFDLDPRLRGGDNGVRDDNGVCGMVAVHRSEGPAHRRDGVSIIP